MFISEAFNAIPELAHLDEATFIQNCENVLKSANQPQAYNAYSSSLGLKSFMGANIVPATAQEKNDLLLFPPEKKIRVEIKLERKLGQRLVKHVRIAFWSYYRNDAHAVDFCFPIQFLGYGAYSLCHFDNRGSNIHGLTHFFARLQERHVNFHRTFVFTAGKYELNYQPTIPLLNINAADKRQSTVNQAWLDNLKRMATEARKRQVILEICLFPRQSAASDRDMPLPEGLTSTDIGGAGPAGVRNFFKVGGDWQPLQQRIIDGIAQTLLGFWNVVYEVGNELGYLDQNTDDTSVVNWANWAACHVHKKTYNGNLVTCSGTVRNEGTLNKFASIDFCSFHRGQWNDGLPVVAASIENARARCAGFGDKHLVVDDDGATPNPPDKRGIGDYVRQWAVAALKAGGTGPCSFNHKGPYDPVNSSFTVKELVGQDELDGLGAAWQEVFKPVMPGVPIYIPKEPKPIQV